MSTILHGLRTGLTATGAVAVLAFAGAPAPAATFTYDFDIAIGAVFLAGSGAPVPGSPFVGETGTASLSFDIDTSGLVAGDALDLDYTDVSAFDLAILGQSFDESDAANVLSSPFGPGNTPLATLVAGAGIGSDPFDLDLSFFGVGLTEVGSLETVAGGFTFAADRLTAIDAPNVLALVALFDAGGDPGSFLAPSYTDGNGNAVTGETGTAVASLGVVPLPPAVALSLTALGGLAAFGRRRARA
ncbi:MAG: hypothetical protein V2I65_07830 [Paracoccaceae bacterium]|jgi:hypothetical protein|nr:hypothetical protein [Paracoccaceae bacterium]